MLDVFQLEDIRTAGTYLEDLGRPEAAKVFRAAAIAEAQARQGAEQERLKAEEAIAEDGRNLALKQAAVKAEIDAAQARTAAAGPLAQAERDQAIIAEQQKVAERNAELKERQLDTEVRKPADAARYRVEQEAEAAKNAAIAGAQASAEQAKLLGEGERARRAAAAEAVRLEGAAEADAVLARGQAEAAAMRAKAEAFELYGQAAVLDLLVRVLPEVVGAASAPIGEIDSMTVISTEGATSLTRSVANNVAQGLQLGTDLTGIDLKSLLSGLATGNGTNAGKPEAIEAK